jgi:heat shock protein HslJ
MSRRFLAIALLVASTGVAFAQQAPGRGQRPAPSSGGEVIIPKSQKVFPTDVQWSLVQHSGKATGPDRPTIQLDQQFRMRGFGGCNTFSATAYPMQQQRFGVGPIAATKKACSADVMAAEKRFLVALRTAQTWDVKDGFLILNGQGGELRFSRSL